MTDLFRFTSASRTDKGNVRSLNEDSLVDHPSKGIWAVADGMGGHAGGDVASRMLVDALHALPREGAPGDVVNAAEDAVIDVNARLWQMSSERGDGIMGTTLAMLLAFPRHCVVGWVGDSRVYRARMGALTQVTQDHSAVEELVARGTITREEARDHASANVVTRAVGGTDEVHLDLDVLEIEAGDRFLICSDGLYKELEDPEILELMTQGDAAAACEVLLTQALKRDCRDNVTVVVVDFQPAEAPSGPDPIDRTVPLPQ